MAKEQDKDNSTQKVTHTPNIVLKRSSRGHYSWEIRSSNDDLLKVIEKLEEADTRLKEKYEESS